MVRLRLILEICGIFNARHEFVRCGTIGWMWMQTLLRRKLDDPRRVDVAWSKGVALAVDETGLDCFPEACIWSLTDQVLNRDWWPDA